MTIITGVLFIAFAHTISTNTFLVKWGKVEDASLLNVFVHLFFDLSTFSNLKLANYFFIAFTFSKYCAIFFP